MISQLLKVGKKCVPSFALWPHASWMTQKRPKLSSNLCSHMCNLDAGWDLHRKLWPGKVTQKLDINETQPGNCIHSFPNLESLSIIQKKMQTVRSGWVFYPKVWHECRCMWQMKGRFPIPFHQMSDRILPVKNAPQAAFSLISVKRLHWAHNWWWGNSFQGQLVLQYPKVIPIKMSHSDEH